MGEITRQPARAIQNALIDSVLAGLCALIEMCIRDSAWLGFRGTAWQTQIDVRDFIQHNYLSLIHI